MFYPDKIVSISTTDRVLEIGPGGSPHPRSDVLLEKEFSEQEAAAQRGHAEKLKSNKELVFYKGKKLPFADKEFDYVICSHVLEHIEPSGIPNFLAELQRVAPKGYIEYPTINYEYLYNFKVHKTLLNYDGSRLFYLAKSDTPLDDFFSIQKMLYRSLQLGFDHLVRSNKERFVQGFEWKGSIEFKKATHLQDVVNTLPELNKPIKTQKFTRLKQLMRSIVK